LSLLILSIDLIYFSKRPRSLGTGTLLVAMKTLSKYRQINSDQIVDLAFFRRPLMKPIWILASVRATGVE